MRAVAVPEFGAEPRLMELPKPAVADGEILVRLRAASLNPFDRAIVGGFLRPRPHVFPLVLGIDGVGVVEEVAAGVESFEVGDQIYGVFLHEPLGRGTMADYIAVPESGLLAQAPRGLPAAQAAAAPTAGMTAIGLMHTTRLAAGESVLIVGASGGVGSFAVQLAASRGTRVIAAARPDATAMLLDLGAAETVDYSDGATASRVREAEPGGVDVLLDLISEPPAFAEHTGLVRDGGRAISLRYAAGAQLLAGERIAVGNFNVRGHPDAQTFLAELTHALEAQSLTPTIDRVLSLDDVPRAFTQRLASGARGKLTVAIDPADVTR